MTTPRGREHTRPEEARAPGSFVERPTGPGLRPAEASSVTRALVSHRPVHRAPLPKPGPRTPGGTASLAHSCTRQPHSANTEEGQVSWAHGGSAGHTGAWALCSEPQQAKNRPQRPLGAQSHTSHPSTTVSRRPPHLPGQGLHRQPQVPAQLGQEHEPGEQHRSGHAAHAPACRGGRDGNPTASVVSTPDSERLSPLPAAAQ